MRRKRLKAWKNDPSDGRKMAENVPGIRKSRSFSIQRKRGIDTSLLEHVSPIEWDNVLPYGEYVIDPKVIR